MAVPPTVPVSEGGGDALVGVIALVVVLGLAAWAYVASAKGASRKLRPTGVTRLTPSHVH